MTIQWLCSTSFNFCNTSFKGFLQGCQFKKFSVLQRGDLKKFHWAALKIKDISFVRYLQCKRSRLLITMNTVENSCSIYFLLGK